MSRIRFHLDENVSHAVADGLRRQGIDVTTTPEQGLLGVDDEEQLAFAHSRGRVLFTHDSDFLRLHDAGVSHFGIVHAGQDRTIGEIIRGLILIHEVLEPNDLIGQREFLS